MRLAHKELLRQLKYNSLTGIFIRKMSNAPSVKIGDIAGSKNKDGYIVISINSKSYLAHVLAWFYVHGYWPENMIDHKDRIRHHNWIFNLRESSNQCNIRNTGNRKDNTSGIKGVYLNNLNKWYSQIKINQKGKSLGTYKEFDNAVCARLAGEQCLEWEGCDSCSPAYLYVTENIQGRKIL